MTVRVQVVFEGDTMEDALAAVRQWLAAAPESERRGRRNPTRHGASASCARCSRRSGVPRAGGSYVRSRRLP